MQKLKNLLNNKKYAQKEDLLGEYIKMSDAIRHKINYGEITDEYYLLDIARSAALVNEVADLALGKIQAAKQQSESQSEKSK